ncbi:hypothetical protein PE066_05090 [Ramlibacter tataouinensis]|uniref:hypothetical protein n=1 Tax=Ramlibacter tataouinensis TaxID=94132 RepID=UPI0022F3D4DD|nr:hypothetical protein [Ramlibacter tataouinensis]WBY02916.1 hypothetical protein PE066_05090 [Ramlibacter tataouinensis]
MSQQLLQTDERGIEHAMNVLTQYLPGLDPGLVPITDRQGLLSDATMRALRL